jgi:CRISPR-associated protein Cst2
MSRQKIRYAYANYGFNHLGWNQTPIIDNGTYQFDQSLTISDSEEMDLFGYMMTKKGHGTISRNAICRFSNAVSLETFKYDMDFGTNLNFARRAKAKGVNLVNTEVHQSFYTYDVIFDLNRVGIDGEIQLSSKEKTRRILNILEAMKLMYVDIKGRRESLQPLFIIGGIYGIANPVFSGRIRLSKPNQIDVIPLREALEVSYQTGDTHRTIANDTLIGVSTKLDVNLDGTVSIEEFFNRLTKCLTEE